MIEPAAMQSALCQERKALIKPISKIQKIFHVKRNYLSLMLGTSDGVVRFVKTNSTYALLLCHAFGAQTTTLFKNQTLRSICNL